MCIRDSSMGAISNPSRVFPGKRLPGHMGFVRVTVQNLTVVKVAVSYTHLRPTAQSPAWFCMRCTPPSTSLTGMGWKNS